MINISTNYIQKLFFAEYVQQADNFHFVICLAVFQHLGLDRPIVAESVCVLEVVATHAQPGEWRMRAFRIIVHLGGPSAVSNTAAAASSVALLAFSLLLELLLISFCFHTITWLDKNKLTFFSLTRRFWNQILTCLSVRLRSREICSRFCLVMNLFCAYSCSSWRVCCFEYGCRFFLIAVCIG